MTIHTIQVRLNQNNGVRVPVLQNKKKDGALQIQQGDEIVWERIGKGKDEGLSISTDTKLVNNTDTGPVYHYPGSGSLETVSVTVDMPLAGDTVSYDIHMPDADIELDPIIIIDPHTAFSYQTATIAFSSLLVGAIIGYFLTLLI